MFNQSLPNLEHGFQVFNFALTVLLQPWA